MSADNQEAAAAIRGFTGQVLVTMLCPYPILRIEVEAPMLAYGVEYPAVSMDDAPALALVDTVHVTTREEVSATMGYSGQGLAAMLCPSPIIPRNVKAWMPVH